MLNEKKYNFVYITINLINWKMYIGDHSTNDLNNIKTKNYLGSGTLLKKAKKKYKKENFIRIDLEFFNTKQEAFEAQEKYIKLFNTLQPNGYNINSKGGSYFSEYYKHKEETKLKMHKSSIGKKKSTEHCKHISESKLGTHRSEETKEKLRNLIPWNKGKINCYSSEALYKMGNGRRGKINTQESNIKRRNKMLNKEKPEKIIRKRIKITKEIIDNIINLKHISMTEIHNKYYPNISISTIYKIIHDKYKRKII